MIIEYDSQYEKDVKKLLEELQTHIISIDREKYSVLKEDYKDKYFEKTMKEIDEYQGKMFIMKEDDKIIGLVVGLINNDEIDTYDLNLPKRGRVTELIVEKAYRKRGVGLKLLSAMESYLKSVGCQDILIGVFAYNDSAIEFYKKCGYHIRTLDMTKSDF